MKGSLITYPANLDGQPTVLLLDRPAELKELKAAIGGGYLEAVPYFDTIEIDGALVRCVAFCDEEGKLKNFPANTFATMLWIKAMGRHGQELYDDILVGSICVVIGDTEFMRAL